MAGDRIGPTLFIDDVTADRRSGMNSQLFTALLCSDSVKCCKADHTDQSLHLNLTEDAFQLLKTQSEHSKTAKQAAVKTWQSISSRETPFGDVCV